MGTAFLFDHRDVPRLRGRDDGGLGSEDGWERAKRALKRDWDQTKYDLNFVDGLELNQDYLDTIRQILGWQRIPRGERPNPQKLVGNAGHRFRYGAVWPKDVV